MGNSNIISENANGKFSENFLSLENGFLSFYSEREKIRQSQQPVAKKLWIAKEDILEIPL